MNNLRFTILTLVEDITGDKTIDYADLSVLAQNWLTVGCNFRNNCDGADINGDNKVDFADFALLAAYWLESFLNGIGEARLITVRSSFIRNPYPILCPFCAFLRRAAVLGLKKLTPRLCCTGIGCLARIRVDICQPAYRDCWGVSAGFQQARVWLQWGQLLLL